MNWTSEKIDELRLLWKQGESCSQIARRLADGCTRNAVIGKVHRLGLGARVSPSRPVKLMRERRAPVSINDLKQRRPVLLSSVASVPLDVSFDALEPQHCRWATSLDRPHTFCGHPSETGRPYCAAHSQRAFVAAYARVASPPQEAGPVLLNWTTRPERAAA